MIISSFLKNLKIPVTKICLCGIMALYHKFIFFVNIFFEMEKYGKIMKER